ncbi:gliding motility protein GldC [Halocola ammonii]
MSKNISEINFQVELDENKVPEKITWEATDNNAKDECKAVMMSVWDEESQNTLRIDLWNKEMTVDEMKKFFHQTLLTMADTFERATNEEKMALMMRDFCDYFAEKMDLKAPGQN